MKSVYLSPSLQYNNEGVGNYGIEAVRMREIAVLMKPYLESKGVKVYISNQNMTLTEAVKDSNSKKPDVHFAIHSNAGGGGRARGAEVYCFKEGTEGEKLAKAIYNKLSSITPTEDRGVKYSQILYEIKTTIAPAALAEIAFHDNIDDAKWIVNNTNLIATTLSNGILDYLGIKYEGTNKEDYDMKKIVLYYGDIDALSAIVVAQKHGCPVMRMADFDKSGLKAETIIKVGGDGTSTRFDTFKKAASLV